ncbi:hypothetical protein ABIF65_002901 [Bradyrhizobium japonicum]
MISIGPMPTGPSSLVDTASNARTVVLFRQPVDGAVGERGHDPGLVLVPGDILQHPAGIGGERGVGDGLRRRTRRARMSFGLGGIAQELIDLVMEDQRQAGQAEQQQEGGRDQAGPGVDHGPEPDRARLHEALPSPVPRRWR